VVAPSYKVIAQKCPTSTSAADVYTVPAGAQVIVSSVNVTALDTSRPTLTLDVRKAGAAASNDSKLVVGAVITPGRAHAFGRGITLDATDVLTATCSAGNKVTVQVFGTVIS
jgi:hypothetical protein